LGNTIHDARPGPPPLPR